MEILMNKIENVFQKVFFSKISGDYENLFKPLLTVRCSRK